MRYPRKEKFCVLQWWQWFSSASDSVGIISIAVWLHDEFFYCIHRYPSGPKTFTTSEKRLGHTGSSPEYDYQDEEGPETCTLWGESERAAMFQPREQEAQGNFSVRKYFKGVEIRKRLFSVVPSGRKSKRKHRRFPLNTSKYFCAVQVTEHLYKLPREAVGSPVWGSSYAAWMCSWVCCTEYACWSRGWAICTHISLSASAILWNGSFFQETELLSDLEKRDI